MTSHKTKCLNGHEYTEANTYYKHNGTRQCRACAINRAQERRRKLLREKASR